LSGSWFVDMVFFLNYVYSLLLAYLISKNYSRVKVSAGAFLGVLLPIFLIWLSICGGQYDVGTDYWSYYGFFNGEDFYKFRDSGEYLFAWIISLCNSLGLYGQSLFYVFYGINFYFFYLILKRIDLKYIFLFILLYITITGLFNNQLNALRQATAIYMGTYALILIVERKKWKAFFFIILFKRKKPPGCAGMQPKSFSLKAREETLCYRIAIRQSQPIERSFK